MTRQTGQHNLKGIPEPTTIGEWRGMAISFENQNHRLLMEIQDLKSKLNTCETHLFLDKQGTT